MGIHLLSAGERFSVKANKICWEWVYEEEQIIYKVGSFMFVKTSSLENLFHREGSKKVAVLTTEHGDCSEVTSPLGRTLIPFLVKHCFEHESGTQNNHNQVWTLFYFTLIFKSRAVQLCFSLERSILSLQMLLWASDYCKTANITWKNI